jgi:cellobiose dehydrogenase (acceptor)
MTVTQYLGTGSQSRGRMTVTRQLNTFVTLAPYLHNEFDKQAVIQGIENIRSLFKTVANVTFITPADNQTTADFVNAMPATAAKRRANHWLGSARIGTDSGLNGGNAVVDLNTKVYGTDNLFVVDGSIFPGQTTGNPSAAIVIVAEHAAQKILALKPAAAKRSSWALW